MMGFATLFLGVAILAGADSVAGFVLLGTSSLLWLVLVVLLRLTVLSRLRFMRDAWQHVRQHPEGVIPQQQQPLLPTAVRHLDIGIAAWEHFTELLFLAGLAGLAWVAFTF